MEVMVEMEQCLRQNKSFLQICNDKFELRDIIGLFLRVCTDRSETNLAQRVFHSAHRTHQELCKNPNSNACFPLVSTAICNLYLTSIARSNAEHLQFEELQLVRKIMDENGLLPDSHTYQALMEIHYRTDIEVTGLWKEMRRRDVSPTAYTLRNILTPIITSHPDPTFVIDVVKSMTKVNAADYKTLLEVAEGLAVNDNASADELMWVLFELEQVCVLEKILLRDVLHNSTVLMSCFIKCARKGDVWTAELLLALMDRHCYPKSHDIQGLMVYCYAVAKRYAAALDLVNEMGNRGLLEHHEGRRKFNIDSVRVTMDTHYLMILASGLASSSQEVDKAFYHLEKKETEERRLHFKV